MPYSVEYHEIGEMVKTNEQLHLVKHVIEAIDKALAAENPIEFLQTLRSLLVIKADVLTEQRDKHHVAGRRTPEMMLVAETPIEKIAEYYGTGESVWDMSRHPNAWIW